MYNEKLSLQGAFWGIGFLGGIVSLFTALLAFNFAQYGIALVIIIVWSISAVFFIWRSGRYFKGKRIWIYLSRSATVIFGIILSVFLWVFSLYRPDFSSNSTNIASQIERFTSHPYIGFWKVKCTDNYGTAIERASDKTYYVRFCGPGGCFRKSSATESTLVDDPRYTIVDNNTISVTIVDPVTNNHSKKGILIRCG